MRNVDEGHTLLNAGGRLLDLSAPVVMGILNATPDSFFAGSRVQTESDIASRADAIIQEGGQIIDVGAFSTRPGADMVSLEEEMRRMRAALAIVRGRQPDAIMSVDTFRPEVAQMAVEEFGAAIINDVSEGGLGNIACATANDTVLLDIPPMFRMVARLHVAYVLMSVKADWRQMLMAFAREVAMLRSLGVCDVILDPGFGFGKDLHENYQLMASLERLKVMGLPVLVGVSRKSMLTRLLGCEVSEALNATTALHAVALMKGAKVLRVHDVAEAVETCKVMSELFAAEQMNNND